MFSKLLELIKQALQKMLNLVDKNNITDSALCVSDKMKNALDLWDKMYRDCPPWERPSEGIFSTGIPAEICSELSRSVMLEMETKIVQKGANQEDDANVTDEEQDMNTRASYLNKVYQEGIVDLLQENLEDGMATGGLIIKPYHSNGHIYFDFCAQGEFVPLQFSDDGIITDIAFIEYFISGSKKYTKVERHIFNKNAKQVTVINQAYVSDDTDDISSLGRNIPLSKVDRWKGISEAPVILNDVEKPLYGFYKVPRKNNIDRKSPLGISVFSRGAKVIEKADYQFARLDWEYHAGQMAIDVDPTAVKDFENMDSRLPNTDKRVFRKLDANDDSMYHEFAPALRDASYINGLNTYLMRIEDLCALARGTISYPTVEARTATEVKILKQRAYDNISNNQKALQKALEGAIYAMNKIAEIFKLAPDGEIETIFNWNDSVLEDTESQLNQKIILLDADVIAKAEVRSWYTGESLEQARAIIEEIERKKQKLNDLFTAPVPDNDNGDNLDDTTVMDEE